MRLLSNSPIPSLLGLLIVAICLLGCGVDTVCPTGTAGSPCVPTGALENQPELPSAGHAYVSDVNHATDADQSHSSDTNIQGHETNQADAEGADGNAQDTVIMTDSSADAVPPGDTLNPDAADDSPDNTGHLSLEPHVLDPPTQPTGPHINHVTVA